ncbi:hypothetical protein T08_12849 [Trichinella sp. T8]|nr:hypothetical protein T08_12849 [Trichinella sp. T8]
MNNKILPLILIITYASDLIVYEKNLCLMTTAMGRLTVSFDFYFASCLGFSSNNIKGISGNVNYVLDNWQQIVVDGSNAYPDYLWQFVFKTVLNQYCVKVLICNWNIQKVVVVVVVAAVEEVEVIGSELEAIVGFVHCYSIELNSSSLRELTCQFLMRFVEKLLKHETDSGLKNQSKNERGQAGGVSTWEFVSPAASVEKRYFSCLSSNAIDLLLLDSVTHPMYNNQFLLLKIF